VWPRPYPVSVITPLLPRMARGPCGPAQRAGRCTRRGGGRKQRKTWRCETHHEHGRTPGYGPPATDAFRAGARRSVGSGALPWQRIARARRKRARALGDRAPARATDPAAPQRRPAHAPTSPARATGRARHVADTALEATGRRGIPDAPAGAERAHAHAGSRLLRARGASARRGQGQRAARARTASAS
jgi:hypothetical protein